MMEEGLLRDTNKLLGTMGMFIIFILTMVPQMCIFVKMYNCMISIHAVYCTSLSLNNVIWKEKIKPIFQPRIDDIIWNSSKTHLHWWECLGSSSFYVFPINKYTKSLVTSAKVSEFCNLSELMPGSSESWR